MVRSLRDHSNMVSLTGWALAGVEVDFMDFSDLPSIRRLADEAELEISVL